MQRRAQVFSRGLAGSNRRVAGVACAVVACAFLAVASACSNQSEGDRCDTLNGNDDCATSDGLVCYPAAQLGASDNVDRCCPADRSRSSVTVCIQRVSPISDAGQVQSTGDASTGTDSAAEPTVDATTDAPADAEEDATTSDASTDGPSE